MTPETLAQIRIEALSAALIYWQKATEFPQVGDVMHTASRFERFILETTQPTWPAEPATPTKPLVDIAEWRPNEQETP